MHESNRGVLNIRNISLYTRTDVEHERYTKGHLLAAKRSDRLLNTILVKQEVTRAQLRDIAAGPITNEKRQVDESGFQLDDILFAA
jgi:hypothetical protein